MTNLFQDVRFGIRMLLKNPGFTLVAVITLALGIGANTAIFSVVNAVLLRPLPYTEPERLVAVLEHDREGPDNTTGYATVADWREQSETLEHIAAVRGWSPTLTGGGEPERLPAMRVSANFFKLLGVRPAIGRDFLPEEDRPEVWRVVILSHSLWQRRFNSDPDIAGKQITLSGNGFTVAGVMPAEFEEMISPNYYEQAELWAPLGYDPSLSYGCRTCRHLRAIARIKPGVSLEQADAELDQIMGNLIRDYPKEYSAAGVSLVRLQERFAGEISPALYVLLVAVGVVLLIACVNLANLLLARATGRQTEMAIRAALGAGRARIVRQLLTESLLLALMGAVAGIVLALWGMEFLTSFSPDAVDRFSPVSLDTRVLLFTLGISMLTGLLFGLAPAVQASKLDLNLSLKEGRRASTGGPQRHFRSALVVAEIALALVLLAGAGLLLRSFARLLDVAPGFDTKNLLTMSVSALGPNYEEDAQVLNFHREALRRIEALPGVEAVGLVSNLPFSGNYDRSGMLIEEKPIANTADAPSPERYGIDPGYLRAMRIPLLRGRECTWQDNADAPLVVLINQSLAERFWPGEDPLGKRIKLGGEEGPWRTIVGIVGNVKHLSLDSPLTWQVYLPHAQWTGSFVYLTVRASKDEDFFSSKDTSTLLAAVRNEVWTVDKDQPVYDMATMEQLLSKSVAERRFTLVLTALFAALALVMASVGVYGVMSFSVGQRTQEIGIRQALGAQSKDIFVLVIRQGLMLTSFGVALGLASAFALTRFLESALYEVSATDPVTLVVISLLLASVAIVACYIPARRAARVDPMVALRYE
ncbi:MAG: ABC transporter permease [Blastocatellia bacterium]|nr:ABC transporter permease [Blastocatellia bacterium]